MCTPSEFGSCPACGRTDVDVIADREQVRGELEALWTFHLRRLRPDTPPEHLVDRLAFSQPPPARVVRCRSCGLHYREPRKRDADAVRAYRDEPVSPGALEELFRTQRKFFRRQARRLTRTRGGTGRVLEVGSYSGAFLAAAREEGWAVEGLDVNGAASRFTRSLGFRVTRGTLHELSPERRFDAVAIWNCFEQLPDPRETVRGAGALLPPGGVLAIRVPNGDVYRSLRRWLDGPAAPFARAILAHSNLLTFPYRHAFTPACLGSLLRDAGFTVLAVTGETLAPAADRWTRRWAAREERAVRMMLRAAAACGAPAPWFEVYARAPENRERGPGNSSGPDR